MGSRSITLVVVTFWYSVCFAQLSIEEVRQKAKLSAFDFSASKSYKIIRGLDFLTLSGSRANNREFLVYYDSLGRVKTIFDRYSRNVNMERYTYSVVYIDDLIFVKPALISKQKGRRVPKMIKCSPIDETLIIFRNRVFYFDNELPNVLGCTELNGWLLPKRRVDFENSLSTIYRAVITDGPETKVYTCENLPIAPVWLSSPIESLIELFDSIQVGDGQCLSAIDHRAIRPYTILDHFKVLFGLYEIQ